MIGRLINFFFWVLLGALAGVALPAGGQSLQNSLIGMLLAVSGLYIYNVWQGSRMLKWLRQTELNSNTHFSGVWGDTGDRIMRLIKLKDNQRQISEESLRQFLAAIQASPHGVVILDKDSRIQWSNQTAFRHLGLDPRIDVQQLIGNMLRSLLSASTFTLNHLIKRSSLKAACTALTDLISWAFNYFRMAMGECFCCPGT